MADEETITDTNNTDSNTSTDSASTETTTSTTGDATTTTTTTNATVNVEELKKKMYSTYMDTSFYNVSIDGFDLVAEEITPTESYNRRETSRHNIIGGTQRVIRTNYIPREFEFTTHLLIDPSEPDVYDEIFRDWMSKNVEVISKYMGGKFNAECIVKVDPNDSPNYLKLEISLVEIPDEKSLIPNDDFEIPEDTISPVKISTEGKTSKKDKDKDKDKKKDKNKKKNSKKTTKNSNKNKKNKKGNNITKTK